MNPVPTQSQAVVRQTRIDSPMYAPIPEEEGIDIMAIIKSLWNGRKTIIIWTATFMVLGLVAALTMKRTYSVSTVMVPQLSSGSKSSLSSLASLAGFDLGGSSQGSELSPLIYPQIVGSIPFRKELIYTPLHYSELDSAVSMFTYLTEYSKPSVIGVVKKYTIGLPGVILGALRGEKEPVVLPESGGSESGPKPELLTDVEEKVIKTLSENVSLTVNNKEGYLTLSVTGAEPIQTAELAMKAQLLLQDEVTRFRVEKSQSELDYIQARYNEIKREAEMYQEQLARINDRTQNVNNTSDRIERDRIQSKYTMTNSIYSELAKQLEQAKMQVKKDTPVFTIIQPVTVPIRPSNSRATTLIIWTFLGGVLGCGIVMGKEYWPKLKAQFAAADATNNTDKEDTASTQA